MAHQLRYPNSLRYWRTLLGFSQADVAAAAGCSRPRVSLLEHGTSVPNVYMAMRIAELLQLPVDMVFPGPGPSKRRGVE